MPVNLECKDANIPTIRQMIVFLVRRSSFPQAATTQTGCFRRHMRRAFVIRHYNQFSMTRSLRFLLKIKMRNSDSVLKKQSERILLRV